MHWLSRHRLLVLAAICAFCTGLILAVRSFPSVPFLTSVWTGEQSFEDLLQKEGRKTPIRPELVFLGIDQSSMQFAPFDDAQMEGNRALQLMAQRSFPWSREVWALLLDRLFSAGARLVMFDLLFNPPNEGDAAFHDALERYHDKVVLGANFDLSNVQEQGGAAVTITPNATLIPPPQMQDDRVGYIVFFPDPGDQKIRSIRYTITDLQLALQAPRADEVPYESISARALTKLGYSSAIPRDLHGHLMRFSEPGAFQPRALWEVFDPKYWHANYGDGAFFKDKVVVVGTSAQVSHDVFGTPLQPDTPGPVLHLHAIAAAIEHQFLSPTPVATGYALVGGAGLLAWGLIAFVRRPLLCILLLVGLSAAYLGVVRFAFDRTGLLLLAVPVLSAFLSSGLLSLGFEYVLERMEKVRTRRTLERYVSKNLVKEILDNPASFYSSLRGVRIPATILFSDIVGFTSLTENADPEALVSQLNEYLSEMTKAVFDNHGTLDKFIGDAVMAVWGNVSSRGKAEDAKACARAALAMRRELRILNDRWHAAGIAPFAIGIGINHGDVLGGNIGSHEKADPTVIGDAVNLASRLESLTRTYGADVLVGERAGELIRDEFLLRSVARVQVKGKSKPVDIYSLIGVRDATVDPKQMMLFEIYEAGIEKFRARDFAGAKTLLGECTQSYPNDFLAHMYYERAVEYEKEPPASDWNAVEVFKKK